MSGNKKIGPEDVDVVIKFGGGLHSKASPDDINPREASGGFNFLIDLENKNLRNRPPFDLIGTVPNTSEIRGGFSFVDSAGTTYAGFQAGGTVYSWDGATTFTSIGSCSSTCKLRGNWRTHTWNLTDKVIITDLNLVDTVKEWDGGASISAISFLNENSSGFGNFYAKYLNISEERAVFSNVKDGSGASPHMMVGSKTSDYTTISVVNKPTSALGTDDPFYILTPDLKPINGHVKAFGATLISTEKGEIFNLTGTTAQDFAFKTFFPGSYASGDESMIAIGDDVIYGRQGRIESLIDTQYFGNSRAADITAGIADIIEGYTGWTGAFNSRLRHVHMFPTGVSECWTLDTAIRDDGKLSPWMRWETEHSMAFKPTFVDSMLDPSDGLEYIFMGDADGNIFRMEGTGLSGDGGTNSLNVQYLTALFSAKLDAQLYDVTGYIKYAKNVSADVTLTFRWQGLELFDKSITTTLPEVSGASYYGGSVYYGGSFYYGTIAGRIARNKIDIPGQANEFQVLITYTGNNDISINEIGLRFRQAS